MLFIIVTELHKNPEINAYNFSMHVLQLLPDKPRTIISTKEDLTNRLS